MRQIAPDVLIETGTATVTPVDDIADSTHYMALHVRKGDQWAITPLTETPAPAPPAYEALQSLDWLVGSWQDKDQDQTVQTTISWSGDKNFLTCNYKVSGGDGADAQGWQIIGWDAGLRQIRSWIFDSNGGFGQAEWVPQGRPLAHPSRECAARRQPRHGRTRVDQGERRQVHVGVTEPDPERRTATVPGPGGGEPCAEDALNEELLP